MLPLDDEPLSLPVELDELSDEVDDELSDAVEAVEAAEDDELVLRASVL